jgi:hypothetical protein
LGGTSDGFADSESFCLDLGFFQDDAEAMKLLMLHELFHIVQAKLKPATGKLTKTSTNEKLFSLMENTFNEGSASFIANPFSIKDPKDYSKWFQGKYKTNLNRIEDNFQLFTSLFYRLQFDSTAVLDDVYPIGFSDRWGSPFYFVGMRMCELIRKYEGENFLNTYLRKSSVQFFQAYTKYSKLENKPDEFPIFTKWMERKINEMGKER